MQRLIKVLLYIWQLPQNILGLIISLGYTKLTPVNTDIHVYHKKYLFNSGVSLGNYIIVQGDINATTLLHEYGHSLQSRRLGPLYLLLIGVPSLLGNIYSRIANKNTEWYYNQPWEHWADKLGGVDRCSTATN